VIIKKVNVENIGFENTDPKLIRKFYLDPDPKIQGNWGPD
jgi:hypothetical protein